MPTPKRKNLMVNGAGIDGISEEALRELCVARSKVSPASLRISKSELTQSKSAGFMNSVVKISEIADSVSEI